jgi:hypothetical protein
MMGGKSKQGKPKPGQSEKDRIDALTESMLQSAEMDETADYLARNRRFSHLGDGELKQRWTATFRQLLAAGTGAVLLESNDLSAELRLREIALPFATVSAEMEAVRLRLAQDYPKNPEWQEAMRTHVRSFLASLRKPQN